MADAPAFRRGADEAEQAAAAASANFARTHFFKIDDKERVIIRMVTDAPEWIVVDQYQFLPTKPKPKDWEGNWPTHMGAVSRQDPALKGMFEDDCILSMRDGKGKAYKPSPRTWALACMREEVIGDGTKAMGGPDKKGKRVGCRDATREVTRKKDDGTEETTTEKAIVVLNMGYKNFFAALDGFYREYDTVVDRDYVVIRKGTGTDTTYSLAPLDPIPGYDLRDPDIAKRYETDLTLDSVILGMADDDYYARFFDPKVNWTPKSKDGDSSGAPADQQGKPDVDAEEKIRRIADRVKDYEPDAEAADEPAADEPAAESESAPSSDAPLNFD